MGSPIPRSIPQMPSWLRQQLINEDAMRFAPRPSMDEIVARMDLPGDVEDFLGRRPVPSVEDALRQLASEAGLAERMATRATDEALTPDVNVFGAPVKTIEQGRALGERNLPGIENLSPENQIALGEALNKGAMLRAMTATSPGVSVKFRQQPSGLPRILTEYGDRAQSVTGAGLPFFPSSDLSMGQALALLGNKRQMRRTFGFAEDLPNPPAFEPNLKGELIPSDTAEALGSDVADLVRTIRKDQIDSKLMQLDEAQSAQLMEDMSRSADEVAAMEARAREYGGLPPETLAQMDKSNRSHMATRNRQSENLTGNPTFNWARQMGGNMDTVVGSPLYPPSQKYLPSTYDTYADYFWETEGKPIVKGFGLGHVLSYPLIYAAYQMMKPNEPAPGKSPSAIPPGDDAADWQAERERAIAESQKAYEAEQTRSFMDDLPDVPVDMNAAQYRKGYIPPMPDVQIDLPDMPLVSMPQDNVGIPDDPMEDMMLMEEGVAGAPAMDELDAAMLESGLQPSATSRRDISSMEVDGRRVDSLYPPESLEYQMEQAYKRRTRRNPYPALSY